MESHEKGLPWAVPLAMLGWAILTVWLVLFRHWTVLQVVVWIAAGMGILMLVVFGGIYLFCDRKEFNEFCRIALDTVRQDLREMIQLMRFKP